MSPLRRAARHKPRLARGWPSPRALRAASVGIHRVVSAEHGSPNGSRAQAVRDAAGRFWEGLSEHAEADASGRISREAFRAALDAAFLQGGRFDELLRPAADIDTGANAPGNWLFGPI